MNSIVIKRSGFIVFFLILQVVALFSYLFTNILNIGEAGTAIPALLLYIIFSILAFLVILSGNKLILKLHSLVFISYLLWISIRVIVDLKDISQLREILVGTTGGILLFYLIGLALSLSFFKIIEIKGKPVYLKIIFLSYLFLVLYIFSSYSERLLDAMIFYIADVDGEYQRPGNFMSISFIVISFCFFSYSLKIYDKVISYKSFYFWLVIYIISAFVLLITTQMIGSNSATAVVVGVFLITLVMSIVSINKAFISRYRSGFINLLNSKTLLKRISRFSFFSIILVLTILFILINVTEFNIEGLRLLGYGAGNTSLSSRVDILLTTGLNQISYEPIFGNMNVAFLTTGNAGTKLHSYLPYVLANLGLIGLIIVFILFYMVFKQLLHNVNSKINDYELAMISLFSLFILLYIFIFANLSSSITWAVLNFSLGFFSKPILIKPKL